MRISDWSSDVCSSDLRHAGHPIRTPGGEGPAPCPRPAAWTSAGCANGTPRPCIHEQPQCGGADMRTMISSAQGALLRAIRRFLEDDIGGRFPLMVIEATDRKSTRLNSSH